MEDSDFSAVFDGVKWTIRWKWKDKEPVLTNQCAQSKIAESCKHGCGAAIDQWISDGWLEQHDNQCM